MREIRRDRGREGSEGAAMGRSRAQEPRAF